uniref:Calponin-homology (CH) domain-containing protein n=1 Tax=Parastrongyloides trichosuri TaxID=131310 RepID=A0A0N4ZEC5_PARTI
MDIYQYSTLYYDQDPYEMEKVEKEKYDVFKSIFKKVHLVKRTIEYEKDLINISTIINEYKFIHEKVINNNEDVKKYLTKANIMGYVDAASLIFNKPVFPDRRYELLNFFIQTISKIYENDTIFSKDSSAFHIIMKNVNGPYYGQNDDTIIENYIPTTSCSIREMAMNACLDEYKKHMKIKKYSIDELEAQLSQTFENTIRQRISIMDHNQIIINKQYKKHMKIKKYSIDELEAQLSQTFENTIRQRISIMDHNQIIINKQHMKIKKYSIDELEAQLSQTFENTIRQRIIQEMAMNACLDEYKKHMKIKKYSIDELEAQLSQTFENTIRQRISIMDHNQIIINKRYASPNTRYNIYFQEFLLLFNVCNLIDAMNACLDEYKKHMKIKKYSIDELEAQLSQTFENTIRQRISIMDHNQIIINKRYASPNTRYNIYFQEFLLLFNVCNLIDIKNMKLKPTTNQKVIKDYGIILDLLDKYIQNPQTFNSTIYKDLTIISRINLGLIMEILFIVILIIMKNDKSSIIYIITYLNTKMENQQCYQENTNYEEEAITIRNDIENLISEDDHIFYRSYHFFMENKTKINSLLSVTLKSETRYKLMKSISNAYKYLELYSKGNTKELVIGWFAKLSFNRKFGILEGIMFLDDDAFNQINLKELSLDFLFDNRIGYPLIKKVSGEKFEKIEEYYIIMQLAISLLLEHGPKVANTIEIYGLFPKVSLFFESKCKEHCKMMYRLCIFIKFFKDYPDAILFSCNKELILETLEKIYMKLYGPILHGYIIKLLSINEDNICFNLFWFLFDATNQFLFLYKKSFDVTPYTTYVVKLCTVLQFQFIYLILTKLDFDGQSHSRCVEYKKKLDVLLNCLSDIGGLYNIY